VGQRLQVIWSSPVLDRKAVLKIVDAPADERKKQDREHGANRVCGLLR